MKFVTWLFIKFYYSHLTSYKHHEEKKNFLWAFHLSVDCFKSNEWRWVTNIWLNIPWSTLFYLISYACRVSIVTFYICLCMQRCKHKTNAPRANSLSPTLFPCQCCWHVHISHLIIFPTPFRRCWPERDQFHGLILCVQISQTENFRNRFGLSLT